MQSDDTVSSWLSQQANSVADVQALSKAARSRSGSLRAKVKPSSDKNDTGLLLDRTSSHVSTSSLDSVSSSAGGWSPRTAADARSKPNPRSRKGNRIRSSMQQALPDTLGTSALTADAELVKEPSLLSNASFDSDASLESGPLPRPSSRLSPAKTTRRGSDASLHSPHSILDPLPEKPTDVVRHRKVFGSTYSVGKLGELPYTAPPRTRGSLSQPPWVASAIQKDASSAVARSSMALNAGSRDSAVPDERHGFQSQEAAPQEELTHSSSHKQGARNDFDQPAGTHIPLEKSYTDVCVDVAAALLYSIIWCACHQGPT